MQDIVFVAKKLFTFVAWAGLLLIAGCGSTSTSAIESTYAISGVVSGDIADGVLISLGGSATATTTTAAGGLFSFPGLADGSYTVTPSKVGYTFNPVSIDVIVAGVDLGDQSFIATSDLTAPEAAYAISGVVSGDIADGVVISLSGSATGTTTTSGGGLFSFPSLANGNYTLTPSKTGYAFNPASITVTVAGANLGGQSFIASLVVMPLTVSLGGLAGAGSVTSSPAGISCGTVCSASFAEGTSVTLTPTASYGATFVGWNGDCTGTGGCTVTMSATRSVMAVFAYIDAGPMISVLKNGTGTGTVVFYTGYGTLNCGSICSMQWGSPLDPIMTATADSGSTFAGWSGGGCSGTGTCTPTSTGTNTTVTATFTKP